MTPKATNDASPDVDLAALTFVVFGLGVGAALAILALPDVAPAVARSMAEARPKTWWYLSRTTGVVAYGLLSASMLLGLLLSTRLAQRWPGAATALDLHRHTSLLGLALSALHALVLLGDRHTPFSPLALAVPFASSHEPFSVGLGQVALYGAVLVTLSSYARRRLGPRGFRVVHLTSYAVFCLSLAHGLALGTDRSVMFGGALVAAGVSLLALFRLLRSRTPARGRSPAR